jgi:uncharacterized OB-fold protein
MNERPLTVFACAACGTAAFPQRLACPQCGSRDSRAIEAAQGIVEETTIIRHRAGEHSDAPIHLATVRTLAGPLVIAQLEGTTDTGALVRLFLDPDGAIIAAV